MLATSVGVGVFEITSVEEEEEISAAVLLRSLALGLSMRAHMMTIASMT